MVELGIWPTPPAVNDMVVPELIRIDKIGDQAPYLDKTLGIEAAIMSGYSATASSAEGAAGDARASASSAEGAAGNAPEEMQT